MRVRDYRDRWGRIHEYRSSSCNNAWLYTAVFASVGGKIDIGKFHEELTYCISDMVRHPGEFEAPPISNDEVLGMAYLAPHYMHYRLKERGWTTREIPKFNLSRFVKQGYFLFRNRKAPKFRNLWWEHKLDQTYWFTCRVPLSTRYFIKIRSGETPSNIESLAWWIDKRPRGNRSSRQLNWLKHGKDIAGVENYYRDKSHPSAILAQSLIGKILR